MERYRLKNIMILILALVNGFFLVYYARQTLIALAVRHQMEEELAVLFASDGVTLHTGGITHARTPECIRLRMEGDPEAELSAFFSKDGGKAGKGIHLIGNAGDPTPADGTPAGGGQIRDSSPTGGGPMDGGPTGGGQIRDSGPMDGGPADGAAAPIRGTEAGETEQVIRVYPNGDFITGPLDIQSGAASVCRRFCRKWSFRPDSPLDPEGGKGSHTVSATAHYRGLPVFNCKVWFSFEGGNLRQVSGTLLPRRGTAVEQDAPPLGAVEALAVFQSAQKEQGAVLSEILAVSPSYELTRDAWGLALEPSWRVGTDTLTYYVNGVTGVVTAA